MFVYMGMGVVTRGQPQVSFLRMLSLCFETVSLTSTYQSGKVSHSVGPKDQSPVSSSLGLGLYASNHLL